MAPQLKINAFRLKKHRKLMGYSQREAANLLGISPSRLSQWEKGIKMPNVQNLLKLSILYHTLPDELYYDLRKSLATEIRNKIENPIKQKGHPT